MARALLSECASCKGSGFLSSQVREHVVDGQEPYQCQRCYVKLECDGTEITHTRWRHVVGKSKFFAYFVNKNAMTLRANGGRGAHTGLKRFYMDNKKFITREGKEFTLGTWIQAVKHGQTAPKAAEALQTLHDVHDTCTQQQSAALEAGLDWVPMILGDGRVVGSLVQKFYCEQFNAMPITDGQWFLFKKANGNQLWICAVCGCIFSASNNPLCVGMKTGPKPQDLLIVRA
eukprot:6548509-Karenia_brevis.AAC.1